MTCKFRRQITNVTTEAETPRYGLTTQLEKECKKRRLPSVLRRCHDKSHSRPLDDGRLVSLDGKIGSTLRTTLHFDTFLSF